MVAPVTAAEELFRAGDLPAAIDAQLAAVKKQPSDTNARFFLAELAAMSGDWDRADRQLDAVLKSSSQPAMLPLLLRQLLRGETSREQVFAEGRPPEIVVPMNAATAAQLQASTAIRLKDFAAARESLDQWEQLAGGIRGRCDGQPFETLVDLDDRLRGIAEVITATGKYFWVPWNSISQLTFEPPSRPMDLIWRKVQISVSGGLDGEVYMPTRYPGVATARPAEQMIRETAWTDHECEIATGRGLRNLLIGDEVKSVMELTEIEIDSESGGQ